MNRELIITRLGNQGDGVAEGKDGPVYVPFTLPGERVLADVEGERGTIAEILDAAPERCAPICRHFGECGGCAAQHVEWQNYLGWKRARIAEALSLEGIDFEPAPVKAFGPHTRRRAVFAAVKTQHGVTLGFRRAHSHDLIGIEECPVLLPRLEAAISALRECLAAILPAGEARVHLTTCDNGIDMSIDCGKARLRRMDAMTSASAGKAGIIRITERTELVAAIATPIVTIAGVAVELPPGAFLQASSEAADTMADIAVAGVGKARKIADLYSGLGAFTFALARRASVTAVEIDNGLISALQSAARRAQGLKPIKAIARNLSLEPLSPMELNAFDAVLFDPPRAGALAQAKAIALSKVRTVVAISCNPTSFAKDAKSLINGGYALLSLTPIDQFVFSPHIELIAIFTRNS